ncbi:hypothetical protein PZA11_008019 [Diplocarpon coronariae]
MVPNLTIHLYKERESIYITVGRRGRLSLAITISIVIAMETSILIPATMAYSSEASIALITLLHFIEL